MSSIKSVLKKENLTAKSKPNPSSLFGKNDKKKG